MKYDVTFSCGHTQTVQLFGKSADRARKIDFFEKRGVCSNCFKEQKEIEDSIDCKEVEMSYKDYKTDYPNCKTKAGSYDGEKKQSLFLYRKSNHAQVSNLFWDAPHWCILFYSPVTLHIGVYVV